jgi:Holliday junction resolvasome RuvABC endonuclease subunit
MIITAIDPGTRNSGIVTIKLRPDKCLLLTTVCQSRKPRETEAEYLLRLKNEINCQIESYPPTDLIAFEAAHLGKFHKSYAALSKAIAIVEQCASVAGIPVVSVQPAEWKKGITGNGNANYDTIRLMLIAAFEASNRSIIQNCSEHELAAIGISICAGRQEETRLKIEAAEGKEGAR